jgi:ParB-like chromosome segregation protein Spo0J
MADHIGQLKPDPRNARRHTARNVGLIADALNEVGAARSIVIDESGVILAGNATVEAAAQAGIEGLRIIDADGDEIIAVRRSNLTPEQKRRLALFDNRAAELAEWDPTILESMTGDTDLTGLFRDDELAEILNRVQDDDDDEAPSLGGDPTPAVMCPACGHAWIPGADQ